MNKLDEARKEITDIDAQMLKLFEKRMSVAEKIAEYKNEHGLSIRDRAREAELVKTNKGMIANPEVEPYYGDFLEKVIDLSCNYQTKLLMGRKIGYSGVEGAFAYIAAMRMFPDGELISYSNFEDAYKACESGEIDTVVLPIENSYAGEVVNVMELLFSGDLYINQVMDLDVCQNLMSVKGASIEGIRTVVSHPQALDQCDKYIKDHNYATQPYVNTARAAQYVKALEDPTVAAIASDETARIYDLEILEENINSSSNNTTRFAALSRSQNTAKVKGSHENESFILVFTVRNEAGALAQTLNILGAHGFNMRSLRSRPMKNLIWQYFFYIEAEGNINTPNGRDMMQELSAICAKLKLVGSYYSNNTEN